MQINRFIPFVWVYFFINAAGLPFGLTYTSLLAPVFYFWVAATRKTEVLLPFAAALLPFITVQVLQGVDTVTYCISLINLSLVYLSAQAAYTMLKRCNNLESILYRVVKMNFILCLVAIPLYFTSWADWVWSDQGITEGIRSFRRLKMFTYEPSYYAFIFTPIFFYFLLQYLLAQNRKPGFYLITMITLPYFLSFSLGVMASILIALVLTWLFFLGTLTRKRRIFNGIVYSGMGLSLVAGVLMIFFRNNALFLRLTNIFLGKDTSGNGRTGDAFILADKILEKGDQYWGIGIGQVKIVGRNIIRDYYFYINDFTVAIPNAVAETWVVFGWVGLSLRFLVLVSLFFITRVWSNYYRLLLFFFLFIYQFTGSYITNLAEYVGWILAFTNVFPQFDRKRPGAATRLRPPSP